ncbi:hypothetical protein TL16_g01807 [Triparma laevis f. inornata]|uniref:Uncharacterized protein n=1 Tax=Triparma laevis f. inornata TaxID=1714386 RepID=A0A9W7DSW4_9STRA|nr:hypothetical protein TL16_g01807 [Triparma laevis f. inornata]
MTIPESLQTLGEDDFHKCFKLVPSHIDISNINNDVTANVVHHLRTQQRIAKLEKMLAERDAENAALNATIAERDAKIAKYSEPALDTTN